MKIRGLQITFKREHEKNANHFTKTFNSCNVNLSTSIFFPRPEITDSFLNFYQNSTYMQGARAVSVLIKILSLL